MKKIDTLADLRIERARLKKKSLHLETQIKTDFESLKSYFSPLKMIKNGAQNVFVNANHGLVSTGINAIVGFVMRNVLLRNAGFITRLVVPFLAKNTANNLVADNKTKIMGWISELFLKVVKKKKKEDPIYDSTTAGNHF